MAPTTENFTLSTSRLPPGLPAGGQLGGAASSEDEPPLVFFKGGISVAQARRSMNTDSAWTSYIKLTNRTDTLASRSAGSLDHGPEGCLIAGHLNVRKVPGTLRLALHNRQ